jgi:hypothetical protein
MIGTRRRSRLGWHGHPVLAGVNVDPGGLRVGHLQAFTRRGLTKVLLSARRHSGLHHSRDRGKTQRPQAREAFVNCSFPTGDTRGRATNDVFATPGARLTIGHAAPFRPRPPRPAALPPTVSQHATQALSFVPFRCRAARPHHRLTSGLPLSPAKETLGANSALRPTSVYLHPLGFCSLFSSRQSAQPLALTGGKRGPSRDTSLTSARSYGSQKSASARGRRPLARPAGAICSLNSLAAALGDGASSESCRDSRRPVAGLRAEAYSPAKLRPYSASFARTSASGTAVKLGAFQAAGTSSCGCGC